MAVLRASRELHLHLAARLPRRLNAYPAPRWPRPRDQTTTTIDRHP